MLYFIHAWNLDQYIIVVKLLIFLRLGCEAAKWRCSFVYHPRPNNASATRSNSKDLSTTMLIPIDIPVPSTSNRKLPPAFAKVSHDETVLIELQGALDVESSHESERNGNLVGKLSIDEAMVRVAYVDNITLSYKFSRKSLLYVSDIITSKGRLLLFPKPSL